MKTRWFLPLAAAALLFAGAAHAQVLGQFTGAETLPVNGHMMGAYLHSSQNVVGLLGQLRMSFYPDVTSASRVACRGSSSSPATAPR